MDRIDVFKDAAINLVAAVALLRKRELTWRKSGRKKDLCRFLKTVFVLYIAWRKANIATSAANRVALIAGAIRRQVAILFGPLSMRCRALIDGPKVDGPARYASHGGSAGTTRTSKTAFGATVVLRAALTNGRSCGPRCERRLVTCGWAVSTGYPPYRSL